MLTVNIIAADTDAEARRQFTSPLQSFTNLQRGHRSQVPPPIDDIESYWSPAEKQWVETALKYSFVGAPEAVKHGLRSFLERTQPDELMIGAHLFDHQARLRPIEIAARIRDRLS